MKKICFVGTNSVVVELINSIKNYDISAISLERLNLNKNIVFKPVNRSFGWLYSIGKMFNLELTPPLYFKKLNENLDDVKPDTIITGDFFRIYFYQVLKYIKASKKNIECYLYTESKQYPKGVISRLIFSLFLSKLKSVKSRLKGVFVYSKYGKEFFFEQRIDSRILPLPVNCDKFEYKPRVFMPHKTLRVLMNARAVGFKRHMDLINAIELLCNKGVKISATFIGDGPLYEKIEAVTISKELPIKMIRRIPYEEIQDIYHQHDVLVLPSYNEAIGIVVAEAMATGMPTITSDTVGANIYVKENITGFIYPTEDIQSLANAIKKIANPVTLKKMGLAATKRVNTKFSPSAVNKLFSIYMTKSESEIDKAEDDLLN